MWLCVDLQNEQDTRYLSIFLLISVFSHKQQPHGRERSAFVGYDKRGIDDELEREHWLCVTYLFVDDDGVLLEKYLYVR